MNENTTKGEKMDKERIAEEVAEARERVKSDGPHATREQQVIVALADALEAALARAECVVVMPLDVLQECINTAGFMAEFECQCDESVGHICEACWGRRLKAKLDALLHTTLEPRL